MNFVGKSLGFPYYLKLRFRLVIFFKDETADPRIGNDSFVAPTLIGTT